jgi:3-mercaptopyruvate sulfurtransferase SseA
LGLISGYADYHKKGRPKGSLHGGNIDRFITEQGTKGDFNDVLKLWDQNKIDWQSKQLILFCGTGWRAAEAFIYGLDSGLPNLSVFSGIRDWIESSLPLEQH